MLSLVERWPVQLANPKSHGDGERMRIWCFKIEHSSLKNDCSGNQYWGFGVGLTIAPCKNCNG
jgi:hypothetical protein